MRAYHHNPRQPHERQILSVYGHCRLVYGDILLRDGVERVNFPEDYIWFEYFDYLVVGGQIYECIRFINTLVGEKVLYFNKILVQMNQILFKIDSTKLFWTFLFFSRCI